MKGKENEDLKRKASESNIDIGEKVYVKNMIKENKLTPEFDDTTHMVLSKTGIDVNVENDETGIQYRRNIIHLKKVEGKYEENGQSLKMIIALKLEARL